MSERVGHTGMLIIVGLIIHVKPILSVTVLSSHLQKATVLSSLLTLIILKTLLVTHIAVMNRVRFCDLSLFKLNRVLTGQLVL